MTESPVFVAIQEVVELYEGEVVWRSAWSVRWYADRFLTPDSAALRALCVSDFIIYPGDNGRLCISATINGARGLLDLLVLATYPWPGSKITSKIVVL